MHEALRGEPEMEAGRADHVSSLDHWRQPKASEIAA
jgi:hypothetical protein